MLTVREAAHLAEVTRMTVYRRVHDGDVAVVRTPSRTLLVSQADVAKLRKKRANGQPRVAVSIRPVVLRHAAWVMAAGGRPVSVWLGELADSAVTLDALAQARR